MPMNTTVLLIFKTPHLGGHYVGKVNHAFELTSMLLCNILLKIDNVLCACNIWVFD